MKRNSSIIWIKLFKYDTNSYKDRYKNKICDKLKENNIMYFVTLDYFLVKNRNNKFKCTLYVCERDYNKSLRLLKE